MTDAEINRLLEELGERSPECRILVGIIHHLQSVIAELRAESAQLRVQVRALEAELAEERRKNGRPTAPHRIPDEKRAANPKRPGRPPGHPGALRAKPDHIDEELGGPRQPGRHMRSARPELHPAHRQHRLPLP